MRFKDFLRGIKKRREGNNIKKHRKSTVKKYRGTGEKQKTASTLSKRIHTTKESKNNNEIVRRNINVFNKLNIKPQGDENISLYKTVADWLGTPYKYGGITKNGVDCSGFASQAYKQAYGKIIHRSTVGIFENDVEIIEYKNIKEGDLIFFKTLTSRKGVSHVGIYLKDDLFAHASSSRGVMISTMKLSYWQKHYYRSTRVKI